MPVAGTRTGGFMPPGAVPMGKQEGRNPVLGLSPAAPTSPGAPGSKQELIPLGPPPLPAQQFCAQLSDTRSAPAGARGSAQHLSHRFGTKSLRELAPPDSLSPPYLTPTESPPALPSSQLTQISTIPKPQGITPNPIKHRCAPGCPKSQMFTSRPPLPPPTRKRQLWGED